jgi:uncharacterized protein (TIGR03435 family)
VVDLTGLKGDYSFTLDLNRVVMAMRDQDSGASIFTVVNDDLGLKLERRRVPLNVLVLDKASKTPLEN